MSKASKSFEGAMRELETILAALQNPDTTLEDSVKLYAKAADLIAACDQTLQGARVQVEEIGNRLAAADAEETP